VGDPSESSAPEHLRRLNPEQHRAVTTIHGPVLVLAGAGSGKTRVLTRRIAHLLHSGVSPKNILAVTFTNKAATEMRERIVELVGPGGEDLWVSTFHSTCARVLRADAEALGWTRRFAIYDDDDQLRLLKSIIGNLGYDTARVDPREISGRIDHYKNRMLGPEDVLGERRSHVGDPLIRIWREYDEALKAADAFDFNDLIGRVVEMFQKNPEILQKWRERFGYVLVDEYQDTNRGQYLLLRLLCDEHRNLAVVGDDDQSIYGFRGAEVSNILNFQNDYPEAAVIRLEQNYRSTGNILSLANAVVSHNPDRLDKKLWTDSSNGPKVQLIVAQGPREEGVRVADAIQKVRRLGVPYGDVAIIYRTNAVARHFEGALRAARIPHRVVGGRKFYERREIRDILAYLRLVVNPGDDAAFLRVVNVPPRGVGAKTLAELRTDAQTRGLPLLQTARMRGAGRTAGEKGVATFVGLIDLLATMDHDMIKSIPAGKASRELNKLLPTLVATVIDRSGYREMLESDKNAEGQLTQDATDRLKNLDALVEDASAFDPRTEGGARMNAMELLTGWLDRIALAADADEIPEGGEVTLMTVHSSKGLEFPVVFVVQMNEGLFPHERSSETGVEEERRLAYVAFTRAMQRLIVTRSLKDITGGLVSPSRFLFGVPEEVLDGDLPGGTPAVSAKEKRKVEADHTNSKMAAFLAHRRAKAALPDGQHTLIEIESEDQLETGTQIWHPRHGVGRLMQISGGKLRVQFVDSVRPVDPRTPGLRIVAD
jgi:DNA helicase-2/ATP-dependent DNA helicase PcrA